ncbi:MAG: hypothetical protein ACXV5I_07340, partial [Halobacteriota archaeon]
MIKCTIERQVLADAYDKRDEARLSELIASEKAQYELHRSLTVLMTALPYDGREELRCAGKHGAIVLRLRLLSVLKLGKRRENVIRNNCLQCSNAIVNAVPFALFALKGDRVAA